MIDREKVIKGLEEISDYFFSVYHHSKDREEINKAKDRCDAVEDALTLLKEQEWRTKRLTPTEPDVSINTYGVKFYYCPHCKRPILKSGIIGRPRHCEDCGQAVKWND